MLAMLRKTCLAAAPLLLCFSPQIGRAQISAPTSPVPPPAAHQEPCWKQAGISRSVIDQYHGIEHDSHLKVDEVCENSSLTPVQKQRQVKEIREQSKQKMDALLTPDQQTALHSCQQARHPNEGHHGGNPCAHEQSPQTQESHPTGKAPGSNPQPAENDSQN